MHTTPAQLDMDHLIQLASGTMALGTKRRTNPTPDLITTAIAKLIAAGHTVRTASSTLVHALNAGLGTAYSTNDLGKWRRADRALPQPVQDWLLRDCLHFAIDNCGGTAPSDSASLDRLAAMLCPPQRLAQ